MNHRPHQSAPIDFLETLVHANRANPAILAEVEAELAHRSTDRAARLHARIVAVRDGLELPLDLPPSHAQPANDIDSEPASNPLQPAATQAVITRMLGLIDYVIAVEKDKLKIVTDVADHKGFHRSHDELAGLPGVTFNASGGDGATWLQVERLTKSSPPPPEEARLAPWVVLSDDPSREPRLRESLSAKECQQANIARDDEFTGVALNDLADADALKSAFADYVARQWLQWSEREKPRRTTIALYGNLFALKGALAAPDGTPQEFVCGIGYAALTRNGKRLRYPLLTVALDIELDRDSHVISVLPREEIAPFVEADPLDVMELAQVDAWRADARRVLGGLEDAPLSPFARETYDPVLRQAAALLDPQAIYNDGDGAVLPPPMPGNDLVITNAFGFFQRERRATQLMADLLAFRSRLENADEPPAVPGAVAALFTDPSDDLTGEDFPTFRGINSIPGVTSSDGMGQDLFFPKPFNGEQVQIVQRLSVRDGVVVQGPPGTGKTHTIANIISHYLATGRRVLVTSQKSPALQVLQDQLPAPIRPLAVSLLDSDREGLKQFRGSVDLIAERLQSLRRSDLESEISALEHRINGLHGVLAQIDHKIETLGRKALEPVQIDLQNLPPLDAAREVLDAGDDALWIEDAITPEAKYDPTFSGDEIASIRQARAALGPLISYLGKPFPPSELLQDIEGIVASHNDLTAAAAIERKLASDTSWALADETDNGLNIAQDVFNRLTAWSLQRDELDGSTPAWDRAAEQLLSDTDNPVLSAIRELADDARALAEEHAWFLSRPVDLPDGATDDPRFLEAVNDLRNGGQGLGAVASFFARKTKHNLSTVRLKATAPSGQADWDAIGRFIDANARAKAFSRSWNHACAGTGLPAVQADGPAAGREALQVFNRLDALKGFHDHAASLTQQLRRLMPLWPDVLNRAYDAKPVLDCLRLHLDRARLVHAEARRTSLLSALRAHETPLHEDLRSAFGRIGSDDLSSEELRLQLVALSGRVDQLYRMIPHFDLVDAVSVKVRASGAATWAHLLRTEPAQGEDRLCPGDWARRWRLRRLASWLDASQKLDQFRALHGERQKAEADLSRAYTRLIEQRTWLALKQQASQAVMTALTAYGVAVSRIGKGTGKSANRHRRTAQAAANAVKGALPCWIMPHHRVSESLPSELGIFDLVIVDEASQSTLSGLPALFRAKQILVVGDDRQVSPDNVGLAMDQANARAARYLSEQVPLFQAPMREEASLYDLARVVFGGDNLMLREHFRCAAPIIEFSKRQFYRNELRPLRLSKASERLDPVLVDVRVTNGYRKGKVNPPEADFIIDELRRMGDDPAFVGRTIGVTTLLGTEQAALIYRRIEMELGIPFIERFNLRVGDPATFQGDERDVMFLSLVATPSAAAALSGIAFEQRFNVAASRARERMILVRSIELNQLSPRDTLRRALLEHFRSPFPQDGDEMADARARCESDFERDVFDELTNRGYCIDTQVRVGAHRIDIVVEGDEDRRLAIECDGDRYHGPEQWPADMARQRTLERAGWRIWRCFASRYLRERQTVLQELTVLLDELDIKPRNGAERSRIYTEYREWPENGEPPSEHQDELDAEPEEAPPSGENTPDAQLEEAVEAAEIERRAEPAPLLDRFGETPLAPRAVRRITEAVVQAAILDEMSDGKVWTNAALKRALSEKLDLSLADRQRSTTRPNEEKWEELVNNALTRRGRSNSLYAKGLVENVGLGQHRLRKKS